MGQIKEHYDSDHVYGSNERGSPVQGFHLAQSTASDYFENNLLSLCSFITLYHVLTSLNGDIFTDGLE